MATKRLVLAATELTFIPCDGSDARRTQLDMTCQRAPTVVATSNVYRRTMASHLIPWITGIISCSQPLVRVAGVAVAIRVENHRAMWDEIGPGKPLFPQCQPRAPLSPAQRQVITNYVGAHPSQFFMDATSVAAIKPHDDVDELYVSSEGGAQVYCIELHRSDERVDITLRLRNRMEP